MRSRRDPLQRPRQRMQGRVYEAAVRAACHGHNQDRNRKLGLPLSPRPSATGTQQRTRRLVQGKYRASATTKLPRPRVAWNKILLQAPSGGKSQRRLLDWSWYWCKPVVGVIAVLDDVKKGPLKLGCYRATAAGANAVLVY